MPKIQIRQWRELHVKGAAEDGKDWGPVCTMDKRVIEYGRRQAHQVKRRYRRGWAKVVKVTRYRLVKDKPINHHPKCFLFNYGAGPGVCDCQRESFKKKWVGVKVKS